MARGRVVRGAALAMVSLLFFLLVTTPGHAAVSKAHMAISVQTAVGPVMLEAFPPGPGITIPRIQPPRSPFQPPSWAPAPIPTPNKPNWAPGLPPWVS